VLKLKSPLRHIDRST